MNIENKVLENQQEENLIFKVEKSIVIDRSYKKMIYFAKKMKGLELKLAADWLYILNHKCNLLLAKNMLSIRKRIEQELAAKSMVAESIKIHSLYIEQKHKHYGIRYAARGSRYRSSKTLCRLVFKLAIKTNNQQ